MNRTAIRCPQSATRLRGTVMMEMVFVMPLLLVITSLVIWFGLQAVRVQHAAVAARYETWRAVAEAPGPYSPGQLNSAFFGSKAATLDSTADNSRYSDVPYEDLIADAGQLSNDAGNLAEALMYKPQSDDIRMSNIYRGFITVEYSTNVPLWRNFEGPFRRHTMRIGTEWPYTNDWRASNEPWAAGLSHQSDHARALRDVFLKDFDDQLDAVDGDANPEYSTDNTQVPSGQALAGMIRSLYLQEPSYRGPIVYDERP